MLSVQETIVKLGGIDLPGQVKSLEIQEAARIDEIEDKSGTTKSNQPTGYDAAKIIIEMLLEDSEDKTASQQIQEVERLFKTEGQKAANLIEIVSEDCSARGISMVYFKSFVTKRVISESTQVASMELWTPIVAEIKTKKVASGSESSAGSKSGTGTGSGNQGSSSGTLNKSNQKRIKSEETTSNKAASVKKSKNSPAAQDNQNTSDAKAAAKAIVKRTK